MFKKIKRGFSLILTLCIVLFGIHLYVILSASQHMTDSSQVTETDYDCIIVLGASVYGDIPSPVLEDRLDKGIELYEMGTAPKIIVSGDHGQPDYDEVNVMKGYCIEQGVPSEDVFMDHAGFSTYDSMYRAKEVFGAQKVLVVSQKYHVFRAVYIGRALGLDVTGVWAEEVSYAGDTWREVREVLARIKDFFKCIVKPESTYTGGPIDLSGSGDVTNDLGETE